MQGSQPAYLVPPLTRMLELGWSILKKIGERMRRFSTMIFCLSAGLLAAGLPQR